MKKLPTIHELRTQGYKVRVTHIRKFYRFDPKTGKRKTFWAIFSSKKHGPLELPADKEAEEFFMCTKGGQTVIEIADANKKEIAKGIAVCSDEDPYVKKIGAKKAIALALKSLQEEKDVYKSFRKLFSFK